MKYSTSQIENAKNAYNQFLKLETVEDHNPSVIGLSQAESRSEFHNNEVNEIRNGNKEIELKWKLFFLTEEVKKDQKNEERKAKLQANKNASADILAPIKAVKKIVAFGKWLNTSGNKFRKQHFNKNYTIEAVNAFLETL